MRNLIEKLIILSLCILGLSIYLDVNPVPYGLVAIGISLLLNLSGNTNVNTLLYLAYSGLCLYDEVFIFFIPLFLYDLFIYNRMMSMIVTVFLIYDFNVYNLLLSMLAVYLAKQKVEYETLTIESKSIRDDLMENTMSLSSSNAQILADKEKDVQIAILNERNRISRELHESVGHLVSSSILQVEALALTTTDENSVASLHALQDRLSSGMKDIRESIHNMHSESLDLDKAIVDIIANYPNLQISFTYDIRSNLPYSMRLDILSIVKEAILNTSKHSTGRKMSIKLIEHPSFISISIKDDGVVKSVRQVYSGIGLISIDEIVEKYSGIINYDLEDGFGIHITFIKEE